MSSKRRSSDKTATFPINGPLDHNLAVYAGIGQLVVNWANNESVFLAMLQNLLESPRHDHAVVVWHSHKNTRARLQLIKSLAASSLKSRPLYERVAKETNHFYKLTRTRNF